MLTAEQVMRRVARELANGACVRAKETVSSELRASVEAELGSSAQLLSHTNVTVTRVISAFGVIDITHNAWMLREVPAGISAADVQARVRVPLLCAPDLAEIALD